MSELIPIDDIPKYNRKDFVSDQTVRWCPGCGDYAILASVQKALPAIGKRKEDIVFISGIGCSSRFPYYMDTYGIHSVHGRAPTLATGLKLANPDLSVWVVTGDGDGLSIGGNHILHLCRRNVDLNVLLFNNRIYGLTKGQYSPTSPVGKRTKSTPMGSIDRDLNPIAVALAAEATFVSRCVDTDTRHMDMVLQAAASHQGTSFVEILQNCVIFNDKAWDHVSDRKTRDDNTLFLEHGQPMVFGKEKDKGIRANGFNLEVVELGDEYTEDDLLVHDETNMTLAALLSRANYPDFPVPMGVIYRVEAPVYEQEVMSQVTTATNKMGEGDLRSLFFADETWTVDATTPSETTEMRALESMDVISEFDEEYMEAVKSEGPLVQKRGEIHESLETDPLASLNLLDRGVVTVSANMPLDQAIGLMQERNFGSLLVVDEQGRPVGIFTEYDVLLKVAVQIDDQASHLVAEFMTPNPDVLPLDASIAHALHLMSVHNYRHVPLVNESGVAVGIVSFRDIISYIETYFDVVAE